MPSIHTIIFQSIHRATYIYTRALKFQCSSTLKFSTISIYTYIYIFTRALKFQCSSTLKPISVQSVCILKYIYTRALKFQCSLTLKPISVFDLVVKMLNHWFSIHRPAKFHRSQGPTCKFSSKFYKTFTFYLYIRAWNQTKQIANRLQTHQLSTWFFRTHALICF